MFSLVVDSEKNDSVILFVKIDETILADSGSNVVGFCTPMRDQEMSREQQYKPVRMSPETRFELREESGHVVRSFISEDEMIETWKHFKKHCPNSVLYPFETTITRIAMVEQ